MFSPKYSNKHLLVFLYFSPHPLAPGVRGLLLIWLCKSGAVAEAELQGVAWDETRVEHGRFTET